MDIVWVGVEVEMVVSVVVDIVNLAIDWDFRF